MTMLATDILTAFIRSNPDIDDIDRLIAMSAYMSKKLEADMLKPIEHLEQEVWPQSADHTDSDEGDSHDTVL